jgi:hypothetical protein
MWKWIVIVMVVIASCSKEPLPQPRIPQQSGQATPINKEKKEMAKKTNTQSVQKAEKPRRKRPGVHAKSKIDWGKGKPGWKKKYRGQGR